MPPEQRNHPRGRRVDDLILHERLATIDERLSNLCDVILDNGQPGALTRIHTRIDGVEQQVADLVGWRRWVHGIVVAVAAIGSGLAWLWEHLHSRPS